MRARIIIFSAFIILLTIFINPLSAFRNSESKAIEWDLPPTPPIQASTCACAEVSLTVTVVAPAPARACACKEEALSKLKDAKPFTADKHTQKEIDKAIKHIQKSLDPDLWVDDSCRLDAKHGHKVFDEEKKAVKHLMKILKDKKEDQVQAAIDKLMEADEILAETAIEDAKALESTDPKVIHEIEKAERELAKAKEDITKERYDRAVDHFKKAWRHAQHAIKKAA